MGKHGMQKHASLLHAREPTVHCNCYAVCLECYAVHHQVNGDWLMERCICLRNWKHCDEML